ncbi:sacsin-like [Pomacea canaliculata]|uniref:sacsin-like n=1 Tax=Pomacea canaliculata TaxID=400727 RepID=UPI000D72E42F|nr:sacsin-like [Pomacea canaliculata]
MAESSEDSEGEELELIRPGLIRELRNVLDEYPDDGQILKEMIQNAEDAGASRVKILADSREFHRQEDARIIKKHPHLKFFQGPALCVYNNEQFTEKDWEGIRMLHTSVKEKDPLKVGRFGLGFKSVFHLTDRLVIVSGEFIMYMDPFKGADRYCVRKRLAGTRGRELESLVRCLDAVFLAGSPHSLDRVFNSQTGLFSGTLFWFPLRRQESELSDTLYTEATLNDLLQAFKAEANSMLMFLKNLEKIELYTRDAKETKLVFTVELSAECVSAVRAERSKFKDSVRAATQDLPLEPVCNWSEVEVQMSGRNLRNRSQHKERWLVVNYHAGKNQASDQLLRLCRDPNLSYQPYVGVAVPLGGQRNFQSQLFCFLPLPLETRSPTGLPVHVNGFFALSQNRRHIKWPTADQVHNRAHMEPALQWNCLLVEELLPLAYIALLHRLQEIHDKKPDEFYKAWPDVATVDNRWQPLVRTLYTRLSQGTFFHTSVPIDTWIPLSQAVLQNLPPSVEPKVVQAIIHIYTISNEKVVRLPHHVMSGLQQLSLENVAQTITPRHVSELVLTHHQYLHDEYKLLLLQYLCSHGNDPQLLVDRFLLPLQDGTFGAFSLRGKADEVFFCEKETQVLFPGLEKAMCSSNVSEIIKNHLKNLAKSGEFSFRIVTCIDVARLLEMSIQTRFRGSSIRLSSQDSWIQQVWLYLKNSTPWNADLSGLCHLALLPCLEGHQIKLLPLKGIYVSLSAPGMSQINKDLSSSLSKLDITVVSLPQYVCDHKQILGGLVHYPNSHGILEVLEKVSTDPTTRTKAESDFNRTASEADISSLISFIANAKQLEPRKVSVLTGLRLFIDMTTKQFVSVRDVNVIGPRDPLPVLPPRSLLMCDESSRSAALKIGALKSLCTQYLKTS